MRSLIVLLYATLVLNIGTSLAGAFMLHDVQPIVRSLGGGSLGRRRSGSGNSDERAVVRPAYPLKEAW